MRCQIVDPKGKRIGPFEAKAPPASIPHIGKFGDVVFAPDGWGTTITLDDGMVLDGSECWWIEAPADAQN